MLKNNFNKALLQSYILTNCKRRLFLELGKNKSNLWFDPTREIKKSKRFPLESDFLMIKGKEYEELVYSYLSNLNDAYFLKSGDKIERLSLDEKKLIQFHAILRKDPDKTLMLLEHEFAVPKEFFTSLFPTKKSKNDVPVDYSDQRPDIIFLGNPINSKVKEVFELLHDGSIRKVENGELKNRFGISIFDIKNIQEEQVGKKHFLEIFYYLQTLAVYLKNLKLDTIFYVRANYNGIFPSRNEYGLALIKTITDIFDNNLLNIISWKEADRIFKEIVKVLHNLWKRAPCSIDSIKLNIHQGCGYCQYIEDCKTSLNMKDGVDPKDWSLKLIPFTSQSMAQQLIEEYKFATIGEVLENIDKIKVKSIPKPIYSELPSLRMKAESLTYGREIYPTTGKTHSYAIPRYSPFAISFNVEYDRNNDKVFATAIFLRMFISSKLSFHAIFDNWWKIWKIGLKEGKNSIEIQKELNEYLIREIPLEIVERFKFCLEKLRAVQIFLKGEKTKAGTVIRYNFASVNEDISAESETILTINTIHRLNYLLELCNILEDYIVVDGYHSGTYFGPDTSVFYWSKAQLENLQNMLERNIQYILKDPNARESYESILMFFTPSDTEVSHPYQHKKLFDVQGFAESFLGFPDIINYTWHGMAEKLFGMKINPKFWIPHFNFLDLSNWLRYLSEKDKIKKEDLKNEIKKQVVFKLQMIDALRERFQKQGNFSISKSSRVISKSDFNSAILPSSYHEIAHVWYLFSKLNSTLQQFDEEYYRTMFPEYGIGKLAAARVNNLRIIQGDGKKVYYMFELVKLSSNIKLSEGDSVLLIPNSKRNLKMNKSVFRWTVYIERIIWNPRIKGNNVITKQVNNNLFDQCKEEGINPTTERWYLFPYSSDVWSNKLNGADGLFQRQSFGTSWLGVRLAYLWEIGSYPKLSWPPKWCFGAPSVYLFAAELLSKFSIPASKQNLSTLIFPKPDSSQQEAIQNSLSHVISAILGPPGTGKSQTIAALIDEFIVQKKAKNMQAKILITSFSYAALRVVIEKIRDGKNQDGTKTPSSQLQMIYIRSETQEPIKNKEGCRAVDDLLRTGSSWKLNEKSHSVTKSKLLEDSLEKTCIIFANAHHLYYLKERVAHDFAFDLICVDEASQLPTDYFMASLQFVHNLDFRIKEPVGKGNAFNPEFIEDLKVESEISFNDLTKVVIVGDHNQLPPVRVKNPPKNLGLILDSLFSYYVNGHKIPNKQLKINYRSHKDIVEFTSKLGLYETLQASERNADVLLSGDLNRIGLPWLRIILDPEKVICSIIHNRKFEIGISLFEAEMVTQIVANFYEMINPKDKIAEIEFWNEKIGVVAPHNAQGRTIIRKLFDHFEALSQLSKTSLMKYLKSTVYSVEKFQGSDRDLIISSIGLSDEDKISAEDEFIYDLNRFNVLTSRAKHKLIFIVSKRFLRYIPEERKMLENASRIHSYIDEFCNKHIILEIQNEHEEKEKIIFRYKE